MKLGHKCTSRFGSFWGSGSTSPRGTGCCGGISMGAKIRLSRYPTFRVPMGTFDLPQFSIRIQTLSFVKETDGQVCGLRENGETGIGEHWCIVAFFSHFSPITPPVFRQFSATCRGYSYLFSCDLMMIPFPPLPPFPPHFPPFPHVSMFVILQGVFGDSGYPGALQNGLKAGEKKDRF